MQMIEWMQVAVEAIKECSFRDYRLCVKSDGRGDCYLQGEYMEADTITNRKETQYTRRWFISPAMSKSEIVATALKCVLTSMEHRTREGFLYRGRAIYMPHYDIDQLHAICVNRNTREN